MTQNLEVTHTYRKCINRENLETPPNCWQWLRIHRWGRRRHLHIFSVYTFQLFSFITYNFQLFSFIISINFIILKRKYKTRDTNFILLNWNRLKIICPCTWRWCQGSQSYCWEGNRNWYNLYGRYLQNVSNALKDFDPVFKFFKRYISWY